jgi:transketolase
MNVQARHQGDMQTDGPAPDDQRRSIVEFIGDRARFIRTETVRLARIAGAGHYTSVFSAAEVLAVLYYSELRIRPDEPGWPDRDRFVLSKGHAAIGLYPVLADRGYFDKAELDTYSRLGSRFGDHPDMKKVPGVDFSSGSLGHGLSVAVGLALASRARKSIARTFVLLGDGELAEGQIWEAAMAAGHYRLGRLVAIVDANQLCIDGFTADVMTTEPIDERFRAFGWSARRVDGHDVERLLETFKGLSDAEDGSPQLIVADTVKGKGVKRMELSLDWHVGNLTGRDYEEVMSELGGERE